MSRKKINDLAITIISFLFFWLWDIAAAKSSYRAKRLKRIGSNIILHHSIEGWHHTQWDQYVVLPILFTFKTFPFKL